jgi:hypothetical protein
MPLFCLKTLFKNHRITYAMRKMMKFVMKKTWNTSPYTGLAITLFRTFFAKDINSNINFIDKSSIKKCSQQKHFPDHHHSHLRL